MGHHQSNRVTQLVTPDLLMNQGPCFTHTPRQPLVAHWDEEVIREDERETKRTQTGQPSVRRTRALPLSSCVALPEPQCPHL